MPTGSQAPTFLNSLITGPDANVAIPFAYDIGNQVTDEINDTVTFSKVSGPTWLSVSTDGTMSGTPPPGSAGTNTFTVRATDLAGAYFEVTLNILVKTPPLANWRLNEAAGPTLFDSVRNFHGTAVGSLVYTQTAAIASAGNFAVKFNGADTAVAIPALNLNTNTVTMTALIKRKGGQATSAGIYFWRDTAAFGLRFGDATTSSNQLVCNWNTSYWTTSLIVPDDQWTFVALAIAPAGGTMYMATNSTVFSANLSGSFTNAAFNSTSYIGYDSGGATRRFNGMMDDVAVYGRTLSSSEITDLAAAAFAQAAPIVTLTSPADGATLTNGTITVSASVVSNDHSIAAVRFYAGLTLLGVDTTEPYTFDWTGMTNGTYALTAKAVYDGVNLVSSLASTVTVTHVSPVIALSSPTNGTIFAAPASINLAAAVTANGNPISKVQFIAGGSTVLAEVLASPYTAAWSSVGVGDYSLKARLFYDSGSTTDSVTLNVTVVTPFQFWQIQYFGSTNNPAAAPDVDNFGNGQNNQFKYVTGLDPTNAAARFVFRIESVDGQPSQKRLVFGPRWNDRIYTPVWITNLLDNASWTALTNSSTNDNGTERTIIDLNATEAQKFYRIRITLP
ncbi:MAG: Ig-like domain-containing protein [Kiritimatiellaeota bacterium]|nr:Ig-like domain-containing protein [Kiritimatiellota bacterium]